MRHVLAHREDTVGFYPRHPILCGIDLFGLALTLLLLASYKPKLIVATLPVIIVFQYAVSYVYHWLPYREFWHKADHQMIILLTGGTFLSYWGTLLPASEILWRLSLLAFLTLAVCIFRWLWFSWKNVGGALYLALGAFPLILSFNELQAWLPPLGLAAFWLGISCYFFTFLIHTSERPNPLPGFFGYREVQHVFVLVGTTLQTFVVLEYL